MEDKNSWNVQSNKNGRSAEREERSWEETRSQKNDQIDWRTKAWD